MVREKPHRFRDRRHAGGVLAQSLAGTPDLEAKAAEGNLVVLGLPRGGVPVAYEVAQTLGAPLDVFLVRKLGVPGREELALGAIASGGIRVLNQTVIDHLGVTPEQVDDIARAEAEVLARQTRAYREGRPPVPIESATVLLVDDGLATGATMRAALQAVRRQHPAAVIVAVPIASAETCRELRAEADALICPNSPELFFAVGQGYEDFSPVTDDQVRSLLEKATDQR